MPQHSPVQSGKNHSYLSREVGGSKLCLRWSAQRASRGERGGSGYFQLSNKAGTKDAQPSPLGLFASSLKHICIEDGSDVENRINRPISLWVLNYSPDLSTADVEENGTLLLN